jgi:hypothetical protein
MDNNNTSSIQNLPIEIQIQIIKSIINESCYEGFSEICSTNDYFKKICETHLPVLRPELNKCILKKRFEELNFDTKSIDHKLINYIANKMTKQNRKNLLDSLKNLKEIGFPFVKGDTVVFLTNITYMELKERDVFVSFLIKLLQNINAFVPYIIKIYDLSIEHSKKEYLLNLSCNLIGIKKVLQKIILNPELNLSEPFLQFFIKNVKISIDSYIRDLDMMITGLEEEINMISDPQDREIMEQEYRPIITRLERRLQFISNFN